MRKNWHDHGSPLTLPELVFTLAMPRHRLKDISPSIFRAAVCIRYSDVFSPSTACRPMAVRHAYPLSLLLGSDSRIYSLNGSLYIQYHSLRLNIPCCPSCADSLYRTGLDHCSEDRFNSCGADIGEDFADLCFG